MLQLAWGRDSSPILRTSETALLLPQVYMKLRRNRAATLKKVNPIDGRR